MREMAAIEALKSEKADKEVSLSYLLRRELTTPTMFPERTAAIDGHLGSLRSSEASCMRCLWRLPLRA